jgi:hypothetical protein
MLNVVQKWRTWFMMMNDDDDDDDDDKSYQYSLWKDAESKIPEK